MSLSAGTRLGPYEVLGPLGAGGMGEVYRARDSKLGRDVALKILPDTFANDPERLARFEREAKTLASLNHPHIAQIYGFEEADGPAQAGHHSSGDMASGFSHSSGEVASGFSRTRALVMELVEGEDLSQRIARGAIPIEDALPIARQIAGALEAAHEQGIIHRDLKPANIKLRPDGTIKVLDFGLAKAVDPAGAASSSGATITSPAMSMQGLIIGTAAYMSPEQARGKAVDRRADIWAFGVVCYEMLTGRRAFEGEEISDVLAAVLRQDIDWKVLPPDTPLPIRRLLERCLDRDPKQRLRDIGEARVTIDRITSGGPIVDAPIGKADSPRPAWRRVMPAVAVVVASALTGLAVWTLTRPATAPPLPVQRYPLVLPASAQYVGETGGGLAVSPDGTQLVYPVREGGKRLLHLRALEQLEAQPIPGTDEAYNPFFSPDGQWIGFFTNPEGKLKKVALRGGPALTLAETPVPLGVWLADDTIVFTRQEPAGWSLMRVPAAGGVATQLTTPDVAKREIRHGFPEPLPGGNEILFSIAIGSIAFDDARIAVLSLATGKYHTVVEQGYHARYVPTGHLVYMLNGNLMAVPFDATRLQTTGPPVPVAESVRGRSSTGEAGFAVSRTGFLVYAPGATTSGALRGLVWVDRSGRVEPLGAPARSYRTPRLSPDGTRVALEITDQENDIWVWDLERKNLTRLTFDPKSDHSPLWSPDGRRIFFASLRAGTVANMYVQAADGTGQAERLNDTANDSAPQAVSPDGKLLVFRETALKTRFDISMLRLDDRKASPLIATAFGEQNPEISPDGRWMAYQSNESGAGEVYVRPFPAVDSGRWQVSTGGGSRPLWARSGRELFYVIGNPNGTGARLMAVPIQGGATFKAGNPQELFEGRYVATSAAANRTFDVSADGKKFLMIRDNSDALTTTSGPSLVFVLNWFDELRRLAPIPP